MNWIFGIIIVLILFFLINNYRQNKKKKQILDNLVSNWSLRKKQEEFHFGSIRKYFENNNQEDKAFHIISDRSATDLDLDETFKIIDRTSSKIGQQYLYYKFRTIKSQSSLSSFNDLTILFETNENLRLKTQLELSKINTNDSYYFEELVTSKSVETPRIIWLIYALSIISLSFVLIGFFFPIFFIILIPIVAINMVFHYKNKWNISTYLDGVSQLSKVLNVSKTIAEYPEIKEKFTDTEFIRRIDKIKLKTAFISFERHIDNEFAIAFWLVSEVVKVLFNLEYLIFYSFVDSIEKEKNELKKMFHFIGEIDSAISTASLKASEYLLCNPTFTDEKKLEIKEVYHPLIQNCVKNDLSLNNRSLLLTGSNMSGKTTFIRSISINSILAQSLNICFAKKYSAPFFKLYSSIKIVDDLMENKSYYLEEVLTIKALVDVSRDDSPCLFVLMRFLKGLIPLNEVRVEKQFCRI